MTRHCEHCTFWKGNETSSRAECGNENVMGTTAHNDTCKHFNAKAWAGNPAGDDSGRISYWGRGLTLTLYNRTGAYLYRASKDKGHV